MSPFAEYLWSTLRSLKRTNGGQPIKSGTLAAFMGMPPRTLRWHLHQLEQAGLVHRPKGPKSGWAVTPSARLLASV